MKLLGNTNWHDDLQFSNQVLSDDSYSPFHFIKSMIAVRNRIESIYKKIYRTKKEDYIRDKKLQKLIAKLCRTMEHYSHPFFLRKMIGSKDPWLWLTGMSFIGIDPTVQKDIYDALMKNKLPIEKYHDHAQFLGCLEKLIQTSELRSLLDNDRRKQSLVEKPLFDWMSGLNTIYSKLMAIRLDLSYTKLFATSSYPELRVVSDWEAFLAYMQKNFKESLVGYVAKFEYGIKRKGIHIHTFLFFNGSVVRQDTTIAKHLGEIWKNEITSGFGIYYNANNPAYKAKMDDCALGVFRRNDAEFLRGARNISKYLAKRDPIVLMAIPKITRTLRRSITSRSAKTFAISETTTTSVVA